ncbi:MAG: HupE/UreJ family protein [Rhodospirillaceae bacterium]|jgi:hypothetical protein|nr:HupE/UreJ family protein [Rhodospirillaceae bacterium]MBT6116632.1 HupE/UreJ family protein [Rhodospirillaceae bacterium]
MNLRRAAFLIPALLWVGFATAAQGEPTSVSRSEILLRDDLVVFRLAASAHDLASALEMAPHLTAPIEKQDFEDRRATVESYLGAGLHVASEAGDCPLLSVTPDYRGMPEIMAAALAFRCPAPPRRLAVDFDLFFGFDPAHRSLGAVLPGDGQDGGQVEFVFDESNRRFDFDTAAERTVEQSWGARFLSVLALGFTHIVNALDHFLFLLVLVLPRLRIWPIVKAVTALVVAHTITMGLAWYGGFDPPGGPIETLIALTIVVVALMNLANRAMAWRWVLAFVFGLLHGLGFYDVLRALHLGNADAATNLLAFNLGIEIGQIAIVGPIAGVLVWWRDRGWYPGFVRATSLLILIVAGFWGIERGLTL